MRCDQLILLSAFCGFAVVEITDATKKSFYEILGVRKDATDRQIKKAFRKLALKYHPDKNRENKEKAQEQFVEIAKAYETLSDTEKRKQYDMFGEDYDKNGGGFHSNGFNFDFDDFFKGFDNAFFSHDDDESNNGFKFSFGGSQGNSFNFDDLFSSEEDDGSDIFEFDPFGDFGFGGNLFDNYENDHDNHIHHTNMHMHHRDMHNVHHQAQHMRAHHHQHNTAKQGGRTCRTVTSRIGNMVTTHTECS